MNPIREAIKTLPGRWTKGSMHGDEGSCGLGHVMNQVRKMDDVRVYSKIRNLMSEVAEEQFPERVRARDGRCAFAQFNDHKDTTEGEVIAVMEKSAVRFDERV